MSFEESERTLVTVRGRRVTYGEWKRNKLEWAKSVMPGTLVCDCKITHQRVMEVYKEYRPGEQRVFHFLLNLIGNSESRITDLLEDIAEWFAIKLAGNIFNKLVPSKLINIDVLLEDGGFCSLIDCCCSVEQPEGLLVEFCENDNHRKLGE